MEGQKPVNRQTSSPRFVTVFITPSRNIGIIFLMSHKLSLHAAYNFLACIITSKQTQIVFAVHFPAFADGR